MYEKFKKCIKNDNYIEAENAATYALEREGEKVTLYFEGSKCVTDWKNNFNFPAKPYRKMKNLWFCHRGFLKVWKSIEPHVVDTILDPTVKEIDIIGYSHGGAVAQLCYEYVKFNRPDVKVFGIGYGSPRVLWGFASKVVKERFKDFIIVRNGNDIVTHLPPVILGFHHACKVKKIGKSIGLIRDHLPDNYLASLLDLDVEEEEK